MLHNKYCKYYNELHEVLRDRPTTFAAYTNEMDDFEQRQSNSRYKEYEEIEEDDDNEDNAVTMDNDQLEVDVIIKGET